ncbi:aromatic alcohol reductase [Aspergillus stella-maris]|uniref:aromatic alcohol reductase n=1 Tax=Aspergillus stella-maris TaxID=1810926 RepID=UPI003CCD5C96
MAPIKNILVIGAGELGTQVLLSLATHANLTNEIKITALLRPSTINSTDPARTAELDVLKEHNILLLPADISTSPIQALTSIFKNYDTIISCTGFSAGAGTQVKLTRAVLDAKVPRYIPWQFGVDYDIIGRGSAQDLFDEQLDVRDLLRSQEQTKWVIISTGMFTSFLFEETFGVVHLGPERNIVTALGGWDVTVSLTGAVDIGLVTAEVVLGSLGEHPDREFVNGAVYVAGDTVSYGGLAELVEGVTGREVERRIRSVEAAKSDLMREPEIGLYKYQVVFGEGRGVAWDVKETWNYKRGMKLQTAEEWAKENLK